MSIIWYLSLLTSVKYVIPSPWNIHFSFSLYCFSSTSRVPRKRFFKIQLYFNPTRTFVQKKWVVLLQYCQFFFPLYFVNEGIFQKYFQGKSLKFELLILSRKQTNQEILIVLYWSSISAIHCFVLEQHNFPAQITFLYGEHFLLNSFLLSR